MRSWCVVVCLLWVMVAGAAADLAGCPSCRNSVKEPTFPFRLRVVVFTYNRLDGLKQLLSSLVSANYPTEAKVAGAISLHIFMDYPKKSLMTKAGGGKDVGAGEVMIDMQGVAETRSFLDDYEWPHGSLEVHRREQNTGPHMSFIEGWYPSRASIEGAIPEFCAFFEDDVEVSRHWFTWTDAALRKYAGVGGNEVVGSSRDPKLLGISLFPPPQGRLASGGVDQSGPLILQQARSWGVVYAPWLWREFRQWYADLPETEGSGGGVEGGDGIVPSRKGGVALGDDRGIATLGPMMRSRGWYMVYPPKLPSSTVLTKKVSSGVGESHVLYNGQSDSNAALANLPPLKDMQAYDVMFRSTGRGPSNLPNYLKKSTSNV